LNCAGGYDYETASEHVAARLGLDADDYQARCLLSGGRSPMRSWPDCCLKVPIAGAGRAAQSSRISNASNGLNHFCNWTGAVLVVSHDRFYGSRGFDDREWIGSHRGVQWKLQSLRSPREDAMPRIGPDTSQQDCKEEDYLRRVTSPDRTPGRQKGDSSGWID